MAHYCRQRVLERRGDIKQRTRASPLLASTRQPAFQKPQKASWGMRHSPEEGCSSCSWLLQGPGSRQQGRTDHLDTVFQPPTLPLRPASSPGSTWSACKSQEKSGSHLKPVPLPSLRPCTPPLWPGQGVPCLGFTESPPQGNRKTSKRAT